ncbi:MAG: hypothetical protein NUK65_11885, partial [Firmicutes bacterium]|nr:hypothetical protein [Bacillota bacterium]
GLKPVGVDFIDRIEAEMVIIDMPREIRMLHKKVLAKCSLVVCTGDPDYHHLLKLREVIDRDPFLIINKYGRLQAPLDFKELFGVEPEKLPLFEGVYDSILTGEPLVCFDGKAEKLFAKLYQKIMLRIT